MAGTSNGFEGVIGGRAVGADYEKRTIDIRWSEWQGGPKPPEVVVSVEVFNMERYKVEGSLVTEQEFFQAVQEHGGTVEMAGRIERKQ